MDAKITKKRLAHMLSYDWIKLVLAIVAAIVVWVLVFTTTATRITNTQRFVVCNYLGVQYGQKIKIYEGHSHEILEAEVVDNLRGGEETFYELFTANVEIGEGDVLMVANANTTKSEKKDEAGNPVLDGEGNPVYEYGNNYFEAFLKAYWHNCTRLDDSADGTQKGYFTQMKEYLGAFYEYSETEKTFGGITMKVANFDESTLNEQAVEQAFRARVKLTKDKRFKKEAQIAEGVQEDLKRIRSYASAYETFFENLEKGYIELTTVSIAITEQFTLEGAYGINLCPTSIGTMDSLKEQFYYYDADGKQTAKNINALFLRLNGLDVNYQYENILYLNALIKDVCTAL